jgi:hypothetical protein
VSHQTTLPAKALSPYNQTLVQAVLVALPLLLGALLPGATLGTWLNFALAAVGAFGMYWVPSTHSRGLKIAAAVLLAGLQVAVSKASDGMISHVEWNAIILAGVAVIGGLAFPNQPAPADAGGGTAGETDDPPYEGG